MDPRSAWCMFYAAVAGFQYHPGAGAKEHRPLSLSECASVADQMLAQYIRRFGEVAEEL